jgi:hypothetical protein
MARNDDEYVTDVVNALGEIRIRQEVRREGDVREILLVFPVGHHCLEQVQLDDTAEPYLAAHPRKLDGQCGSPGAGTDDRYYAWAVALD